MRNFHCDHCQHPVFFENVQCVRCGHALAYLPDLSEIGSLEPADDGLWRAVMREAEGRLYRLCHNYSQENVCNWAIPVGNSNSLCSSCRLTRVIPDLSLPQYREAWYALEVAKRRLVYSLLALGLPLAPMSDETPDGLIFEFLADGNPAAAAESPILTGHAEGLITINVAEADDAEREKRRLAMHEPYRTLLGHFRHEVGHYYWDRLIRGSAWLGEFRELFGDDEADYAQALETHYRQGPPNDWSASFVSAYASSHPWEDWAENWAHYLHVTDTLETATECGLVLRPREPNAPAARPRFSLREAKRASFDQMMADWLAVTYVLNNLNRGLGLKDSYPFVLSDKAIAKLRFVHRVCTEHSPSNGS